MTNLRQWAEVAPEIVGMDPDSIQTASKLFEENVIKGLYAGGQLVVLRFGKPVIMRACGVADSRTGLPMSWDVYAQAFSAAKPLLAAAIHLLRERDDIDLDTPIAYYWPKFGQNHKQHITIRHVLVMRAGLPLHLALKPWLWPDYRAAVHCLEESKPIFLPGKTTFYHPFSYGWLLAEIIRRIDGRAANVFLEEEILEPLGMSMTLLVLPPQLIDQATRCDASNWLLRSVLRWFNSPYFQTALVPAGNLHTTAQDMAYFMQMVLNGGEIDGVRVFKRETIADWLALDSAPTRVLGHAFVYRHGFAGSPAAAQHIFPNRRSSLFTIMRLMSKIAMSFGGGISPHWSPQAFVVNGGNVAVMIGDPALQVVWVMIINHMHPGRIRDRCFLPLQELIIRACQSSA